MSAPRGVRQRQEQLLVRLKAIAGQLGAEVREQKLHREVGYHARSGVCRTGGRSLLLLDSGAGAGERVDAILDFLSGVDTSGISVEPDIAGLLRARGGAGKDGPR